MERRRNLDICKAVAMIFIIICHVLQRSTPHFTSNWPSSFILVMGVPIFFFISGTCISFRGPLSPKAFAYDILKRALMYMWPFVLFIFLRVGFYQQWKDFASGWSYILSSPSSGLWVLWVLVWLNLFADIGLLISYWIPKMKSLIVAITLVIAFIVFICLRQGNVIYDNSFLGYDLFVIYTPIFFIGFLLGGKIFSFYNRDVSIILCVFGLIATLVASIFVKPFLSVHIEDNLAVYYVISLCAICFYYGMSTLLERVRVGELLAFSGRFTLEAYFLHLVLIKNWTSFNLNNVPLTILASFGLTLLCIVNTVAVVAVLYFIPFGHFLMFGRHLSIYKFENHIFDKVKNFFLLERKNTENML